VVFPSTDLDLVIPTLVQALTLMKVVFGPVQTFEVFDDEADAVRAKPTLPSTAWPPRSSPVIRFRPAASVARFAPAACGSTPGAAMSERFEHVGVKARGYGPLCGKRAIEEFQTLKVHAETDPTATMG
jgi:hypothetical protein